MAQFSGGEKTRANLAALLLRDSDLLLLDEPTNYLDFDGLAWLERYLADSRATMLIVSHDRYFLDRVVSQLSLIHIWIKLSGRMDGLGSAGRSRCRSHQDR